MTSCWVGWDRRPMSYIEYAVNKPYAKITTLVKNVHTSNSSASWGKIERASLSRARRPGIYLEAASHIPPSASHIQPIKRMITFVIIIHWITSIPCSRGNTYLTNHIGSMISLVLTSIAWCMDETERRRGWSWWSCPPPQSVSAGQTPPSPKMTPDSLLVWRRWQDPNIIVQLSIGNFC